MDESLLFHYVRFNINCFIDNMYKALFTSSNILKLDIKSHKVIIISVNQIDKTKRAQ